MAAKKPVASDRDRAIVSHKYALEPGGPPVVNVTAISELVDDGKSGAFAGAAVKLTKQGKNYRDEWKTKGERGSRVHAHMESFMRDEEIDQLPDEAGYIDALDKWMVETEPTLIMQEQVALSRLGYGGRFDLIATIGAGEHQGKTGLIDLKTGSQYPFSHTLQLAAYRYADGTAVYDQAGVLGEIVPLPLIDFAGCLYVHDDGTYHLVEYPANETAWAMFLRLLDVYNFARTAEMKALQKAALAVHKAQKEVTK